LSDRLRPRRLWMGLVPRRPRSLGSSCPIRARDSSGIGGTERVSFCVPRGSFYTIKRANKALNATVGRGRPPAR
jgi:hypothetical protein